ncbi:MAG: DJ-1/PfpI family protein [Mycoplasma sp.]|nr:DJ-1/PfpI family protein [Mycoplasma sp.]
MEKKMMINNIKDKKDVLVLIAKDFEDVELITTLDILSRNNKSYDLYSIQNLEVTIGKYNALIKTKTNLEEININNYKALFIPGGPGWKRFYSSKKALDIIKQFNKENKLIASICAAPEILVKNDLINNRTYTSYPEVEKTNTYSGEDVEFDNNLLTAKDYLATVEFAFKLIEQLNVN